MYNTEKRVWSALSSIQKTKIPLNWNSEKTYISGFTLNVLYGACSSTLIDKNDEEEQEF